MSSEYLLCYRVMKDPVKYTSKKRNKLNDKECSFIHLHNLSRTSFKPGY